ncbi:Calcium/calmodulin-dependent protein kinase type 1B [Porphyridium purpureum]|uniref:Calcium/calmodulin-dependent protein kinase type 1B n=1 Tax=Porphyridium purpureum TaxID=35688 RepID=A0A5J4YYF7_PORPP|nr:Calcium/calmodulin-dependent protein kinase type 1B [Porphyridium purpureum]|eukprot:POR0843..scf209_3
MKYRYSSPSPTTGWVTARQGTFQKPQRLFLKLQHGGLLTAHETEDGPPLWEHDIAGARFSENQKGNRISVRTNKGKDVQIRADSLEDFQDWSGSVRRSSSLVFGDLYRQQAEIGSGFYAKVFCALDVDRNEMVAVKVMRRNVNELQKKVIERETQIIRQLDHPHVVCAYDVFESEREVRIVMEYMSGGSLYSRIRDRGRMPENTAREMMSEILMALHYLHGKDIIHRDVKAENVLLDENGSCKLADFGLSRQLPSGTSDASEFELGSLTGTPEYIAPEIVERVPYGKAVDIWALGILLYVMLSGQYPFHGRTGKETISQITNGTLAFPTTCWAGVSKEAMDLVKWMLTRDPNERPTTASLLNCSWLKSHYLTQLVSNIANGVLRIKSSKSIKSNKSVPQECSENSRASSKMVTPRTPKQDGAFADAMPEGAITVEDSSEKLLASASRRKLHSEDDELEQLSERELIKMLVNDETWMQQNGFQRVISSDDQAAGVSAIGKSEKTMAGAPSSASAVNRKKESKRRGSVPSPPKPAVAATTSRIPKSSAGTNAAPKAVEDGVVPEIGQDTFELGLQTIMNESAGKEGRLDSGVNAGKDDVEGTDSGQRVVFEEDLGSDSKEGSKSGKNDGAFSSQAGRSRTSGLGNGKLSIKALLKGDSADEKDGNMGPRSWTAEFKHITGRHSMNRSMTSSGGSSSMDARMETKSASASMRGPGFFRMNSSMDPKSGVEQKTPKSTSFKRLSSSLFLNRDSVSEVHAQDNGNSAVMHGTPPVAPDKGGSKGPDGGKPPSSEQSGPGKQSSRVAWFTKRPSNSEEPSGVIGISRMKSRDNQVKSRKDSSAEGGV